MVTKAKQVLHGNCALLWVSVSLLIRRPNCWSRHFLKVFIECAPSDLYLEIILLHRFATIYSMWYFDMMGKFSFHGFISMLLFYFIGNSNAIRKSIKIVTTPTVFIYFFPLPLLISVFFYTIKYYNVSSNRVQSSSSI